MRTAIESLRMMAYDEDVPTSVIFAYALGFSRALSVFRPGYDHAEFALKLEQWAMKQGTTEELISLCTLYWIALS